MLRLLSHVPLSLALLTWIGACGPLDPNDQSGLRVEVSPADTAVNLGGKVGVKGSMVNYFGDRYPSDHIMYRGLDPTIARVDAGGTVTGVAYGRARIVASRGDLADTMWVSVVPSGLLSVSSDYGQSAVLVIGTDGSQSRQIVSSDQYSGGAAAWLSGDAGLVYQYTVLGGATRLYVSDLAGNRRPLFSDPAGEHDESSPRPSHDGIWVYFGYGNYDGDVWRVHVDGSGLERVTGPAPAYQGDTDPDPSPDGSQVVSRRLTSSGFRLTVRDLTNGTERQFGVPGLLPRWSPDGTLIAYLDGDMDRDIFSIFVIGSDGTGARQVSEPGRVYGPKGLDWSPDGEWLVAKSSVTLDLVQVKTGLTLPLAFGETYFYPSWRW